MSAITDAIFDESKPRTDEDKLRRKRAALENFQTCLRPLIQTALGKENFETGTELVFNSLQDPKINKQVRNDKDYSLAWNA